MGFEPLGVSTLLFYRAERLSCSQSNWLSYFFHPPAPFEDRARWSRYWNALHYTDAMVGRLLDALAERGLLEDTLILVTGDHGEGFGRWHDGNFAHGPHLYEESVKTFLMVSTPGLHYAPSPPLMAHRVGSFGDLLPTVLSLTGIGAVAVPGQDLFSPAYTRPGQYFFKTRTCPNGGDSVMGSGSSLSQ